MPPAACLQVAARWLPAWLACTPGLAAGGAALPAVSPLMLHGPPRRPATRVRLASGQPAQAALLAGRRAVGNCPAGLQAVHRGRGAEPQTCKPDSEAGLLVQPQSNKSQQGQSDIWGGGRALPAAAWQQGARLRGHVPPTPLRTITPSCTLESSMLRRRALPPLQLLQATSSPPLPVPPAAPACLLACAAESAATGCSRPCVSK